MTVPTSPRELPLCPPEQIAALAQAVCAAIEKVIVGKPEAVRTAVATFLAGGHVLIEDVPGLGKTTLALALARCFEMPSSRIQFTADLMPADVTGVSVYDQQLREFRFHQGPIFASVVIADEMNRATPRAQSALLEAMGEGRVSVEGRTLALPDPFFVIATQNPLDMEGTYPLPEAQRDRFMTRMSMGYPSMADEAHMLLGQQGDAGRVHSLAPVADVNDARIARYTARRVHVSSEVAHYVAAIVAATRAHEDLLLGASPRGGVHVLAMSKALAVMDGRDYVTPHDVARAVPGCLVHRVIPRGRFASAASVHEAASTAVAEIMAATPVGA